MPFFTTLIVGKVVVCKLAGVPGLAGESAGGKGETGNPRLPRGACGCCVLHVGLFADVNLSFWTQNGTTRLK